MKKATELDEYQKFVDTQIIQHVNFSDYKGVVGILSIVGVPKDKKERKKKAQSN